jgi:hypothetical protein
MNRPLLLALPCLLGALLAPVPAGAQEASSTTSGNESINGATANPERYLYENGVCPSCAATDVTNTPRAQNLNPEGINYADCEQNLRMDFSLALTGFSALDAASVQTWAGTVDCTQPVNRVATGGTLQPCWQVAPFTPAITATVSKNLTISVYARDLLRYEQPPTTAGVAQTYDPSFASSQAGESACHVQPSDAAVSLGIYFIAVPEGQPETTLGVAYEYALSADVVGPPPPTQSALGPGDTVLTVNWTSPGSDPDIAGYAVYSDPPAGVASSGGCGCGNAAGSGASSYVGDGSAGMGDATTGQCVSAEASVTKSEMPLDVDADDQEASTPESGSVEASTEGDGAVSDGAAADAGGGTTAEGGVTSDAGGLSVHCNPTSTTNTCVDPALTGHQFTVGGSADGGVEQDEASTGDDDGGDAAVQETLTGGGISQIAPGYEASEIDSISTTSLTLSGLDNGVLYHVVVASFDGSGNVGPASPLQCERPGAVNDFWQAYKDDGGGASGCALDRSGNTQAGSLAGIGLLAIAAALARRRRGPPRAR